MSEKEKESLKREREKRTRCQSFSAALVVSPVGSSRSDPRRNPRADDRIAASLPNQSRQQRRRRERRTPRELKNETGNPTKPRKLRENINILIVSQEQHRGKKKLNYTNERRSHHLFLPCLACVLHYISPIRANSISRLKNKRRTQLRNAKNASAIIIVTCCLRVETCSS